MRKDGWTTNGHWAIHGVLEPKFIEELKTTVADSPDIEKMVKEAESAALQKLEISNILADQGEIMSMLQTEKHDLRVWVNPYYLSLFLSLKMTVNFYASGPRNTIVVTDANKQSIGLIMPMSMYDEKILENLK
jgi:hypothetical protein